MNEHNRNKTKIAGNDPLSMLVAWQRNRIDNEQAVQRALWRGDKNARKHTNEATQAALLSVFAWLVLASGLLPKFWERKRNNGTTGNTALRSDIRRTQASTEDVMEGLGGWVRHEQ